jgi:hypothetical protein
VSVGSGGEGGGECDAGERRCLGMAGGWASSSLEVEGESEGWGGVVGGCLELLWQKLKKLRGTVDRDFRIEMGIKLTRDLRDHSSDLLLCLCLDGQKA